MTFARTVLAAALTAATGAALAGPPAAATSPWGADDEIGRLNLMTDASRAAVLSRIAGGKVYDLGVDYHKAMPSWSLLGDPTYQIWMTHTPQGTVVDDPMKVGKAMNEHVSYSGDAVLMYTHTGTHIDALSHFGLNGRIWNGFAHAQHLGDNGWHRGGAEKLPPVIARGVLIDVAAAKGVDVLPDSYRIVPDDLKAALKRQNVSLAKGDAVFIRTGRMRVIGDKDKYMSNPPGIGLESARWLVEDQGAMLLGSDNLSLETFPVETEKNWIPVHTYLEAEQGVAIMEVVDLEALSRDKVYEFAFIGASLKLRGASGAPMRPVALPLRAQR
ncbi:cyclase family protein [Tahibacter soli]|uniref:Cyclase family protein n=1 Tax=Tahibacter soli TaxID=2983605 RepID=A0A9X4BL09_9GAMM|nr:cyclase family protein [Tahibacter soli]MDC8014832.1 cyclase family protein [Tahibacter soli]